MLSGKRNAFTLAETIIVCSLFAIMVIGIILGINRAFFFMNNTRVLVRATNFAREGVEMIYNIRDTNRRKYSGEKDKHRLEAGTGSTLLTGGIYIIREGITGANNDSYIYADYLTGNPNFYDEMDVFFNDDNESYRNKSRIEFTGAYSYYSGGTIVTGNLEDLLGGTGIEFYRVLRVFGVYKKDTVEPRFKVNPSDYASSTPKEMRFCVKVFYDFNGGRNTSELCSIMTNFME